MDTYHMAVEAYYSPGILVLLQDSGSQEKEEEEAVKNV